MFNYLKHLFFKNQVEKILLLDPFPQNSNSKMTFDVNLGGQDE